MSIPFSGWVTACIPHYQCHRYVARAVASLLSQSYRWVRVIVINDGDADSPWPALEHLRDPRLVRFDLTENRGPYFALAVALLASPDPWFLIQDCDDWSTPDRAERLLERLCRDGSDFAVSAQPMFRERADGSSEYLATRWSRLADPCDARLFDIHFEPTPDFRYRAPHHGLFRRSSLLAVGGYYGGFRIGFDTLIVNLVLMTGRMSWTSEPCYHRQVRGDSLTSARATSPRSAYARGVSGQLREIYQRCYEHYCAYREGRSTRDDLRHTIQRISTSHVSRSDWVSIDYNARRLSAVLGDHRYRRGSPNLI
jgi:glycosyltransferase involved in cell wall biosynthesis